MVEYRYDSAITKVRFLVGVQRAQPVVKHGGLQQAWGYWLATHLPGLTFCLMDLAAGFLNLLAGVRIPHGTL